MFIFQWGHGSSLWNITATQAITAWIPLIDCPAEVGGLQVARGSHQLGVLDDGLRELLAAVERERSGERRDVLVACVEPGARGDLRVRAERPALLIGLDRTVVNLAVPSVINDFGITVSAAAWIVTAYIIANAIKWLKTVDNCYGKR